MACRSACRCRGCLKPAPLAVLATFFVFFLSLGNISSFVILYVYLQADFKASAVETGWVGSTAWAVMNFLVPLSSALYVRFGCQRVVLVGVLLVSAGLLATSFARQLWVMYITYGLVFGGGSNMMLTASLNFVTAYYPGNNNIRATSFVSAGQPVGLLVLSASLERACFYLGWRNALRITSAFTLVVGFFCTALMPPPRYTDAPDEDIDCKPSTSGHDPCSSCEADSSPAVCNGQTSRAAAIEAPPSPEPRTARLKGGLLGKKHYQPLQSNSDVESSINRPSSLGESTGHQFSQSSYELGGDSNSDQFGAKAELESRLTSSLLNLEAKPSRRRGLRESESREEVERPLGAFRDCDSEPEASNVDRLVPLPRDGTADRPPPTPATFFTRYMKLLRLPGHWFFFGGIIGSALPALFNVVHFMSFAVTIGIPQPTVSWLLILMSCMEIAIRMVIFICGNRAPISRTLIFAIVCVMGAMATYGIVLSPTFIVITVYIIILGFVRGTIYAIAYGATVDVFGIDCALESYTSLLLSYGIAGALVSTIGVSKDLTGEFTISLHMIAALYLLSAILFIFAHVWKKRSSLTGLADQVQCDVNRNDCEDEKHNSNQENGVVTNGVAVTTL